MKPPTAPAAPNLTPVAPPTFPTGPTAVPPPVFPSESVAPPQDYNQGGEGNLYDTLETTLGTPPPPPPPPPPPGISFVLYTFESIS